MMNLIEKNIIRNNLYLIVICIIMFFLSNEIQAQDTIITKNDQVIFCNVIIKDSMITQYLILNKQTGINEIFTFLTDSIKEIKLSKKRPRAFNKSTFGFGMGLEYGGLGIGIERFFFDRLGIIIGIGRFIDFNLSAGLKLNFWERREFNNIDLYINILDNIPLNSASNNFSIGFGADMKPSIQEDFEFILGIGYLLVKQIEGKIINAPTPYGVTFGNFVLTVGFKI